MDLGVPELIVIAIAFFALFGYKKLPDATRAIGRSLRIFKSEMSGLADDDAKATASPVPPVPPAMAPQPTPAQPSAPEPAAETPRVLP